MGSTGVLDARRAEPGLPRAGTGCSSVTTPRQVMPSREDRVAVEHPGAGVAHDFSDLFPHGRFVAVHRACRAFRLIALEGTFFETPGCVIEELPALRAETFLRAVVSAAEDLDHGFNGLKLGFEGRVIVGHGGVRYKTSSNNVPRRAREITSSDMTGKKTNSHFASLSFCSSVSLF